MNYIGIDISLSSTGLYILKSDKTELYFNYKNHDKLSKWHKLLDFITYRSYENIKDDNYSNSEILKIIAYDKISTIIVNDIISNVTPEDSIIVTEGYSYSSSNTSSLIDLVSLASLIRSKLIKYNFADFRVKSPSTLKLDTCIFSYGIIEQTSKRKSSKPKPIKCKNKYGIAGGNFKKHDMLDAIFDTPHIIKCALKERLKNYHKELIMLKEIPKPIDDIVDAVWLAISEYIKDNS